MTIVNSDLLDEGLQTVMGKERCQNECDWQTARKPVVEPISTRPTSTTQAEKVAQKPINKALDAEYEPARPEPNWMDNLKSCAKSVLLFGGLSFLIFYWKEAGLMAESIAIPAIAVCTALAGWGAGKNATRGHR